jgi:hypothetical protein
VTMHVKVNAKGQLAILDAMRLDELVEVYGQPDRETTRFVHEDGPGTHWRPGQDDPLLVPASPAEAQAMGRCAAARIPLKQGPSVHRLHAAPCRFCGCTLADLLAACAIDVYRSRCIAAEWFTWEAIGGEYTRSTGRAGQFLNRPHAEFWSLDRAEREELVREAAA